MSQRFRVWLAVFVTVWFLGQIATSGGGPKDPYFHNGFPWTFVSWDRQYGLVQFDALALLLDLALLAVLVPLAWVCARSRGR